MVKRIDLQRWCAHLGIKKTGSKQDLEDRLSKPLISNHRCWAGRTATEIGGESTYLTCGAHKNVYKNEYVKGPRKGETCVEKVFKSENTYAASDFAQDMAAV